MKHYYFAENDQQSGPFTIEELKSKRLKKNTLAWTDGMEEWSTADKLDDLKDIIISEPPPLPKRKNTLPPIIETVQITQPKQTPTPAISSKYDLSYEKETEATAIGFLIFIIIIIISLVGGISFETVKSYQQTRIIIHLVSLALRIGITIWVVNIAFRQNRNSGRWGWFAFFFPLPTLTIIGLLKKLKLKIVLDGNLPINEQVVILLEKAKKMFLHGRNSECVEILNKARPLQKLVVQNTDELFFKICDFS